MTNLPDQPKPTSTATKFGWSFLSKWSLCETAWWYEQLRRHPKAPEGQLGIETKSVSPALLIGGATHAGLEAWWLSGWEGDRDSGARSLDAMVKAGTEHLAANVGRFRGDEAAEKAEGEVRGLLQGYHSRWSESPLRVVRGPDGDPLIEKEFHLDLGDGHIFTSRLDAVVMDPDDPEGVVNLEHKTSDVSRWNQLKEAFFVDGQVTGQQLQLEAHYGDRVRGTILDGLLKRAKSVPPFQRPPIYKRNQSQLEKFHLDARRRLDHIEYATNKYHLLVEAGMTQDESARVAFDASHAGSKTCAGCDFLALCKNRSQSEWIVDIDYKPKEPR